MSERVCQIEGCDGPIEFMPMLIIPMEGEEQSVGVGIGLLVCADCKITLGVHDILNDKGRAEIEKAVRAKAGVEIDWMNVSLDWDPMPQEGDPGGKSFEGAYMADDPQIEPVWREAVELANGFVDGVMDFNEMSARLTVLAVVVLTRGYRQFREGDPAGGQRYLASVMRSLGAQIEAQTGDKLTIGVRVKNQDDTPEADFSR